MSIPGSALALLGSGAGDAGYKIERSLRFNSGDSAYLKKDFSSTGNRKTFTFSCWIKRCSSDSNSQYLFVGSNASGATRDDNTFTCLRFTSSDQLEFAGENTSYRKTEAVFRDFSAWMHIVLAVDTTNSTANDKIKLYVNGVKIESDQFENITNPADNHLFGINQSNVHTIGVRARGETTLAHYQDAYLADVYFIDGQALAETDFGQYDDNGVWQPKEYEGTYNGTRVLNYADHFVYSNVDSGTIDNVFDGSTSTEFEFNSAGGTGRFQPPGGIPYTTSIEVYTARQTSMNVSLNGGSNVAYSGVGWTTIATGSGTLNELAFTNGNASNQRLGAIRVDGTILTTGTAAAENGFHLDFSDNSSKDALGTDSSGNSNTWDVTNLSIGTPAYAAQLSSDSTAITSPGNLFDGNTATFTSGAVGGTITFTPSPAIQCSTSLRVYMEVDRGQSIFVNGTELLTSVSAGWNSVPVTTPLTINTIAIGPANAGSSNNPSAIEVDGSILVDNSSGTDSLLDSPSNYKADSGNNGGNYCTLNPLSYKGGDHGTFSQGNLTFTTTSDAQSVGREGTIAVSSGKWYWELTVGQIGTGSAANQYCAGVFIPGYQSGRQDDGLLYRESGSWNNDIGATTNYSGSGYVAGDTIGFALDLDNQKFYVSKNGTYEGSGNPATGANPAATLPSGLTLTPGLADYFATSIYTFNFGQRPFAHTPPTGFLSLCTTNLPDLSIPDGSKYMDAVTYNGSSSGGTFDIPNFNPGFIWSKNRASNSTNHILQDIVRGYGDDKSLYSNLSNDESGTNNIMSVSGNTVTYGTNNNFTGSMVSWAWDAGANSSKTYTVKVVNDSGNKYRFDDFGTSAVTLDLEEGSTYVFDSSDSSVDGHPFVIGTSANSGEYSTGVTYTLDGVTKTYSQYTTVSDFNAATTRKLTITVPSGAPTLYYWCSVHSGMGGQANTNSTAGASNFDGTIQSTVRANPAAGFSIVSYTGNQTNGATVGHKLNATPSLLIGKNRDAAESWLVAFKDSSNTWLAGLLNTRDEFRDLLTSTSFRAQAWNNTPPTSSVIELGDDNGNWTNVLNNTQDYIIYCFAPVEGYSAFGTYTGNNNENGPFVYTGFKPRWIMLKNTSTGGTGYDWLLYDTERDSYNVGYKFISPNSNTKELRRDGDSSDITDRYIDILSNGFKIKNLNANYNQNNGVFFYAAFAEHPFKTARAR